MFDPNNIDSNSNWEPDSAAINDDLYTTGGTYPDDSSGDSDNTNDSVDQGSLEQ